MKIGTRKSQLAIIQSKLVKEAICREFPDMEVALVGYDTKGDRQLDRSLSDFGGKGAFTRDIERAISDQSIDIAVHSANDMPLELPDGLMIGAVLPREDNRDVWICCRPGNLQHCPAGTVVGTGSRRRAIQALELNPAICVKDIRGNVPTRLRKLADGQYDGIILAAAGLKRLGYLADADEEQGCFLLDGIRFYYAYLSEESFLPAAGQGIIAVEARKNDDTDVLAAIHDEQTWWMLLAERAFLKEIGGGCNAAAAINVWLIDGKIRLKARYAGDDSRMKTVEVSGNMAVSPEDNRKIAVELGYQAAAQLLGQEEQHS